MTVLYILDYGTVGGATHAFLDMVTQMKSLGVHPIVATGKRSDFNDKLDEMGIENVAAGHYTVLQPFARKGKKWPLRLLKLTLRYCIKEFFAVRKLSKELNFGKIDIIHTNSARNSLGCYLNRKYGVPHIMHIREFADSDFGCISYNSGYISLYNKYVNQFLSVSNAVMSHWNRKGIDFKKNKIIYDGVYCGDIFYSTDESKYDRDLRCVIVGGVGEPKGQLIAVKAIAALPHEIRRNIILDIVGWGDKRYINEITETICANGLSNQIKLLGARNDVHKQLQKYHIGLMCSKSEGFGLVTAEYMHASLGVIASSSGSCPELIEDNVTGLIFETGNVESLCRQIIRLYHDRALLVELSHNARQKALNSFTDEINAKNIYNEYLQILQINKQ